LDRITFILSFLIGIIVCNTPIKRLTETTADLVLSLILATARRIPENVNIVKQGLWPSAWIPFKTLGKDLHSSTVGIIGLGALGLGNIHTNISYYLLIYISNEIY
jgi:glyoxylate reductase